jgi:VWFA-related protein
VVRFLACAALAVVAALPLSAQTFRSGILTVPVSVTVVDAQGRPVTGLSRDVFEVLEDGTPQPISYFADGRLPVSLGLMLDASDSMRGQAIVHARTAVDHFVGELLKPEDEAFLATFSHSPSLVAVWTRPPASLVRALDGVKPSGGTAIYDALTAAAPLFERRVHQRAAVLLISDGADTASDSSLTQTLQVLRRADTTVYAVAIDAPDARDSRRVNPQALGEITGLTGGYAEVVHGADELGPATERIARELDSQYMLGFTPARALDGSWRSIRVRVKGGSYTTRARRGYYADRETSSARFAEP